MLLTVKLIGDGTKGNPYRVNLPTYRLIHGNVAKGTAIVDLPDHVHPLTADDLKHETAEETTDGIHYPSLCDGCIEKLHVNLDEKYQEHVGEFRVERVGND